MRLALAGAVLAASLGLWAGAADAGERKSTIEVLTEDRNARFDPTIARLRVERMLARQQRLSQPPTIEITSPYLVDIRDDAGVDHRIRRLGELIRRSEQ